MFPPNNKGLVARCHSFWFIFSLMSSHTIFIYTTRRAPLLLSSLHPLGRGPPPGVLSRNSNSGLPYSKPMRYFWATPHPNNVALCRRWLVWTRVQVRVPAHGGQVSNLHATDTQAHLPISILSVCGLLYSPLYFIRLWLLSTRRFPNKIFYQEKKTILWCECGWVNS
jgi:hypothetical protein